MEPPNKASPIRLIGLMCRRVIQFQPIVHAFVFFQSQQMFIFRTTALINKQALCSFLADSLTYLINS
jgi:hypothetical protein